MKNGGYHVAIITTWFPSTGKASGSFVSDQADALIAAGNKVSVFLFGYHSPLVWVQSLVKGKPLNTWKGGKYFTPYAFDYLSLMPTRFSSNPVALQKELYLKYIKKKFAYYIKQNGKPDVIHHHGIFNHTYITLRLSEEFGIPIIITEHSFVADKIRSFSAYQTEEEQMAMLRRAAARIAVSNFCRKSYEEAFQLPFLVIPNMITNDFIEAPLPHFPKSFKPFIFMSIGELHPGKKQDVLLRAFAEAFQAEEKVQLWIVGTGKFESSLKSLAAELKLNDQVKFTGFLAREEVISILDKGHALVVSSEKESFSKVAAESLFRGNLLITTRCKGPEEFVDETNGLVCNVNDVVDMSEKLQKLHSIYHTYDHRQIIENVRKRFSESVVTAKLEDIYKKVAG